VWAVEPPKGLFYDQSRRLSMLALASSDKEAVGRWTMCERQVSRSRARFTRSSSTLGAQSRFKVRSTDESARCFDGAYTVLRRCFDVIYA
jgi:hypothetical protein